MFDISWTDPTRETVGQRKNRKEQQANGLSRGTSIRSSRSSESAQSQAKPALFSLFGGSKKGGLRRSGSHSKVSALRTEPSTKASRRISSYTVGSETSRSELPGPVTTTRIPVNGFFAGPPYNADGPQSSSSEAAESVFSGWTGRSAATESSWGSTAESPPGKGPIIQPLSPKSFVTQSTEVTVSPRDSLRSAEQVATVVHISAAGTIPIEVNDSPTEISHGSSIFDFPIPHFSLPESHPPSIVTAHNVDLKKTGRPIVLRGRQGGSWKAPEVWKCPSEEKEGENATVTVVNSPKPVDITRQVSPILEVTHLQRSIRRMEAASPRIILERLKEEWLEIADASVYRELELEKQLWMLSALRSLRKSSETPTEENNRPSATAKALSLYENHASASFLSALAPFTDMHHLSTAPLSPKSYPNVQPMPISRPNSSLPFASNLFNSMHAFSLPAILPASSLPGVLKECHRTLISASCPSSPTIPGTTPPEPGKAGILHLTILDPSPIPSTLGPILRAWLDIHLILNLEKQFRCINPSRLFPIWLEDAGLRAEGSTRLTVCFLASVNAKEAEDLLVDQDSTSSDAVDKSAIVKQELKSVVGRMLWKEIWGSYVQADRWWWEDTSIIEECEKMGTCWEYAVIQAVKEG
ncbi:hypothetical protein LCER1_G008132 [Lachnellula cervina]|uniref:Uncharacterized protein n=1 Tax=Lachnellula cervina TaxID=1316786 RepID=A0A7D8YSX7_9HELO|nr:hypothetical protein LCER1_G008132 [Lachnellula cervina]